MIKVDAILASITDDPALRNLHRSPAVLISRRSAFTTLTKVNKANSVAKRFIWAEYWLWH